MASSHLKPLLAILASGALAACTTTGTGVGGSRNGAVTSAFTWVSDDGISGTMTAVSSDGRTFKGPFFQITHETQAYTLSPVWNGWDGRARWHGWTGWGARDFHATTYTGKVLANLADPSGARMRCRFSLVRPAYGLASGASGQCQLPDGTIIEADFASQ